MSYAYVNYIGERSESCVIASKQPHNNALATCSEKVCNIRRKRIQKENGTHAKSKKENGVHRHLQPKNFPHKLNLQVNTGGWENGRGGALLVLANAAAVFCCNCFPGGPVVCPGLKYLR